MVSGMNEPQNASVVFEETVVDEATGDFATFRADSQEQLDRDVQAWLDAGSETP